MVFDKKSMLMQRLDKAAKILDLLGDFPHALQVLQANLEDPEIHNHKPILLETLAFLADICADLGKAKDAKHYLDKAQGLDLGGVDPALVAESLEKLQRIKAEIEKSYL